MKTLYRNLMFVFRRFRTSTLLNVIGLSVALAVFMVIMLQVYYDRTYNSCIPDADNIYLLNYSVDGEFGVVWRGVDYAKISQLPYIKESSFVLLYQQYELCNVGKEVMSLKKCLVDENYLRMMGFEMLVGTYESLQEKGSVFVSESFARKYFNRVDVVGETLTKDGSVTISGVYRDFPENCIVENILYGDVDVDRWIDNDREGSFGIFVKVDASLSEEKLQEMLNSFKTEEEKLDESSYTQWATSLKDLHYDRPFLMGNFPGDVSSSTELFLLFIAFGVLIIAGINYTNFALAMLPKRLRSVTVHRIFGATVGNLRWQLIGEAVVMSILAFLIASAGVYLLSETSLAQSLTSGMDIRHGIPVMVGTAVIALLLGLVAGFYPAYCITSGQVESALKPGAGNTPKGKALRTVLIGVQMFASFVLVIAALLINKQREYLNSKDYGFAKDEVISIVMYAEYANHYDEIKDRLMKLPEVKNVSGAEQLLGVNRSVMHWSMYVNDKQISYDVIPIRDGFLQTLGIPLLEGRDFLPNDTSVVIFNEAARQAYPDLVDIGKELPSFYSNMRVIGICKDFNHLSLKENSAEPMALVLLKARPGKSVCYVRVKKGANMFDTMRKVENIVSDYKVDVPPSIKLFDDYLDDVYRQETNFSRLITSFSLLAVLISIIGVFGLVMFDCEYRKREIAVRKVFGSTTSDIVRMFNVKYVKILLVSFVLSVPVSYWIVSRWLENFAYKTEMSWWVFALAFVLLLVVTVGTVTYQCWRAAHTSPVENLKYE